MLSEDRKGNIGNDMYLVSETLRRLDKAGVSQFSEEDKAVLKPLSTILITRRHSSRGGSRSQCPSALGMGTMVGWKRIVIATDAAGRDCTGHMPHIK